MVLHLISDWKKAKSWHQKAGALKEGMPALEVMARMGEPVHRESHLSEEGEVSDWECPQEAWIYDCGFCLEYHVFFINGVYSFGVWVRYPAGQQPEWSKIALQTGTESGKHGASKGAKEAHETDSET